MKIRDAASAYKYLKEKTLLFVYDDPDAEKKYKGKDNIVVEPPDPKYPYKKSLPFFRWERVYLILSASKYHVDTNSYSYPGWCSNWSRARNKQ